MKICIVLGTRPEIIKLFPLILELRKNKINFFIIHTGQHKIYSMGGQFIKYFNLKVKYKLKTDKNFLSESIKKILNIYNKEKPDYIINQGDTNTVLASCLAYLVLTRSKKMKLIHLEAGLRSFDKTMPEENNRIIADHVSDILLSPTNFANENLKNENIDNKKVFKIGNTVVDTINFNLRKINSNILEKLSLKKKNFYLLTLHRPDLVDNKSNLNKILKYFSSLDNFKTIFPIHPRTQSKIKKQSFFKEKNIILTNPCSYLDFLSLQKNARIIFTDSGGVQEEACILKTPCITIRKNTERPETIKIRSNILVDYSTTKLNRAIYNFLNKKLSWSNPYGKNVSKKIIKIIKQDYSKNAR